MINKIKVFDVNPIIGIGYLQDTVRTNNSKVIIRSFLFLFFRFIIAIETTKD
jgi:hypothetical protein